LPAERGEFADFQHASRILARIIVVLFVTSRAAPP
jgi:hypothetical protein